MRLPRFALLFVLALSVTGTSIPALAEQGNDVVDPAVRDYLSANGFLNRGLYDLAAAEYRKFLARREEHEKAPIARYGLAVSLFHLQEYDEAVGELTTLQKPSDFEFAAEVRTILGQSYLALRQHARAAKAFQSVIDDYAEHDLADDAAAGRAEALYLDGKYDDAVAQCRVFQGRWPKSPLLERTLFFQGLGEMALHKYGRAAKRFAGLLKDHSKGPFAEQASLLLAQCHHHNNAFEQAARQYRKVIKQAKNRYLPDALHGLATLLQQQGNAAQAGKYLDQLLDDHADTPLVAKARLQRGQTWFAQERFDQAFELFGRVAEEKGGLADDAVYWMAKCELRRGQFADSARRLKQAIKQFADSELLPEMCYDRAIALLRAEKPDEAVAALEDFRSRFPGHALAADAFHLLATTEHRQRRYEVSAAHCRAFADQYPSHELASAIAFLLAENTFMSGDYQDAVKIYERFTERFPDDSQIQQAKFRLGTALYRLERFDEAESLLADVGSKGKGEKAFRSSLLSLGDIHFQRGEWKKAEKQLGDYLASGGDPPLADDALLKLGLARQRQERYQQALEAYDRLIEQYEQSPHRLQTLFERGQTLVALDRTAAAAEAFEQVLAEGGDSRFAPYALNHLGSIAVQARNFTGAALHFEQAAQQAPQKMSGEALFQQGQALMAAEQFESAENVFTRLIERDSSHPRVAQARAQLAIALARQDRYAEAVKAIEHVEKANGDELDDALRRALRYEKAWSQRALGRTDQAAESYRALLEGDADGHVNVHAILELAELEAEAERCQEAAKLLRRLRSIAESRLQDVPRRLREQSTYRLAVCEFQLDHPAQAADLFDEFLTNFPDSTLAASAGLFCGEALFKTSKHEQAARRLTRVVEEFPSDPAYGPSLLRLGEVLAVLQRWALSERTFNDFLDHFGDSEHWYQARFGVGWARENQSRYDEAVRAYEKVVARHNGPTAARAQFQIGECLFAKKQYAAAVRELLKADVLYAYPEWSAAALFEAGRCFEKLGKGVEARNHFRQVTEKYGRTRWAEMASEELKDLASAALPGR